MHIVSDACVRAVGELELLDSLVHESVLVPLPKNKHQCQAFEYERERRLVERLPQVCTRCVFRGEDLTEYDAFEEASRDARALEFRLANRKPTN